MSSAYCAPPVAFPIPSLRATLLPTAVIRGKCVSGLCRASFATEVSDAGTTGSPCHTDLHGHKRTNYGKNSFVDFEQGDLNRCVQQIHAFTGGCVGRRRKRMPFTEAEREVVWTRWREGALYPDIARELGRSVPAVTYLIVRRGGIPPAERHRSIRVLCSTEREEISRGIVTGDSV